MSKEPKYLFKLRIFNFSASNLIAKDSNGLSDPYFTITLPIIQQKPIYKSNVIPKTLKPNWVGDELLYDYETTTDINNSKQVIIFTVYDKDRISSDFIGTVSITLYSLFMGPVHNEFVLRDGTEYAGTFAFDLEAKQVCKPVMELSDMSITGTNIFPDTPIIIDLIQSTNPEKHNNVGIMGTATKNKGCKVKLDETTINDVIADYAIVTISFGPRGQTNGKFTEVARLEYPLQSLLGMGRFPRVEIKKSNETVGFRGFLTVSDFPIVAQMTAGKRVGDEYHDTVKFHPKLPHPVGHIDPTPAKKDRDANPYKKPEFIKRRDRAGRVFYLNIVSGKSYYKDTPSNAPASIWH